MSQKLIDAIIGMQEEEALNITNDLLAGETDPLSVLDDCRKAMEIIGQRFEAGDCFVPELMLAEEVLKQISEKIKPMLPIECNCSPLFLFLFLPAKE